MEHTIFVGVTTDNELYFVNIEQPTSEHNYFAMSGDTYRLIEEKQGEKEARERLEDGELWKMAVEANHTTDSLNDWVEEVLDTDGWESMFDFNYNFSPIEYNSDNYYLDSSAGGQHQVPINDIKYFAIPQSAYAELLRVWDTYHLKKTTVKDLPSITQNITNELEKAMQFIDNDNNL